jgi:antitoxin (DNA-binding transcriptional repressor) of toxin-antitoxin stability system
MTYDTGMSSVTVSEARAGLPGLLDRVDAGEEVTITRHGHPVAVVVRPDVLRVRRADRALATAATIRALVTAGRGAALPAEGLSEERAEQLVAEVRSGRDHR